MYIHTHIYTYVYIRISYAYEYYLSGAARGSNQRDLPLLVRGFRQT